MQPIFATIEKVKGARGLHSAQGARKNTQRGFTMLLAVVTATILLLIAAGMASIAFKQQILASSATDSQTALYMADAAMECALYLDQKVGAFVKIEGAPDESLAAIKVNQYCGLDDDATSGSITPKSLVSLQGSATQANGQIWKFKVTYPLDASATPKKSCALVEVQKYAVNPGSIDTRVHTLIDVRGYNTCDESNRRLERGITASYGLDN